jgi:hypothetical protein
MANETESEILELVYSPMEDAARSEINQYISTHDAGEKKRRDGELRIYIL